MVNGWKDVTLGQYVEIVKLNPEDEDWIFKVAAITENKTLEEIMTMPLKETAKINKNTLQWAVKTPQPRMITKKNYTVNGNRYVLRATPTEITTAQYIDFCNTGKEVPDCYTALLAIFMIPAGKRYNEDYDIKEVEEDMKNLPVEEALSISSFFLTMWQHLSKRVMRAAKKALKKAKAAGVDKEMVEMAERRINNFLATNGCK